MSLGTCEKCHGPLCVSGGDVACERCGHRHPQHPLALANAAAVPPPPSGFVVPAHSMPATHADRLVVLEKAVEKLAGRLATLEQQLSLKQGKRAG